MKWRLLPILILNGFAPVVLSVQSVAATLYFVNQSMTWLNARSYCKATYTDLAPVKTYNDLLKINQTAAMHNWSSPIWVGLYNDINSWRWSFHDLSLSAIALRKWSWGEPNNFKGIEQCGSIRTYGAWNDMPCGKLKSVICYNAHYPGDSRFINITTRMNWTDAQTYCRRFHTDLATALDATDNNLLQKIAAAQGDSWFGLYRDGWTWTDQTKALNIYWESGQPDNNNTDENCARFLEGLLDDASCTYQHTFICHYIPPMTRQMLRLQVKSDQTVFDAAVQSSLLAQIIKKLEEHGMLKDTTVTWKPRPDGNIFYKKIYNL